ncbi:hypothetical protein MTO96_041365 [Rhipicephalus appendiculatus]
MKKRTSEVTPVASVSIASNSSVASVSAASVSAAPSVTFAVDIADKESPVRANKAPPTEVLRGAPRLARRRIDSISGSDKQRRLSRATSTQDAGAWREFSPAGFGEDPQESHVAVQRPFSRIRQVALSTSSCAPEKRGSKSVSPFDYYQVKASQAKEDMATPSKTPQPEAEEQHTSCVAGTSKALPRSATSEAKKSRSTLSNASTGSASSMRLAAATSADGAETFRVCMVDGARRDGRDANAESKKSTRAIKSRAGGLRCRQPPRWLCFLMVALVLSLTAVVLAFVVRLLTGGPSGTAVVRVCHTHECHEYGRRLSSSLNSSVRPCDSFTQFVCDGWTRDNELGTQELLVSQGLDSVARTLDGITVPQTGQSAAQRGVALYRSCEDLLHGHRDDLAAVREALRDAGITWPRRPAEADVLHTVLATSLRLGWDVLFRFVPLWSPRPRLAVNPGRTIVVVFKRKMASQFSRRGREYFSLLRRSMLPPDANQRDETWGAVKGEISLQEVAAIEELTLPLMSAAYNVPTALPESAEHMMDIPEIGLTRARWAAALREFGLDNVTELVTANQEYLLAFLELWTSLGENRTHVFVSWYTVQVAALLANQNLIVNFYGGHSRRALSLHVAFCLGLAYAVSGPVIFSSYNRHVLRASVRQDAGRLVLGVREFFWKRLVRWGGYDANSTVVGQWSLLDVAFREFSSSDRIRTGDAVGGPAYSESRAAEIPTVGGTLPPLTEDSLVANLRKVASSVTTGIRDDDGLNDAEESAFSASASDMRLLALSRAHHDFTLMPYALSFPHFDVQLQAAVNYGGLGAEVARALGALVEDAYRSQPSSRIWLDDFTRCLSTSPFTDDSGVDVAETLFLGALVDAYEHVRADVDTAKLPGLEAYNDLQILFMALCFAKCRGRSARKTPPSACNLPLMYSAQFARAFGCVVGTPMNQVNRCPVA